MTVLVTGGAGFIGSNLVLALLATGEEVRVFDREMGGALHLARRGAELYEGDILDRHGLRTALEGCDCLFHVAALFEMWHPDRTSYYSVNVDGTRSVLECACDAQIGKVVYTSSAVTIGETNGAIGDEQTVHRGYFLSEYERSKYLAEKAALSMCQEGLPVVVVNPTSVYGPGQTTHLTGAVISFLDGGLPMVVDAQLNFVFVDDVVNGCLAAMEKGASGQRYILGGQNSSLAEFLSLAAEIAGVARRPRQAPRSVVHAAALILDTISKATRRRPWVSMAEARTASHSFHFDTSKARQELGLKPTPLRAGLEQTVAWIHGVRAPGGARRQETFQRMDADWGRS